MGKVGTKSIFLVTPVGSVTSKPDLLYSIDYRVLFGHIASPHPHHFDEYPHLCFNLNWWYFFIFNKTLKETENFQGNWRVFALFAPSTEMSFLTPFALLPAPEVVKMTTSCPVQPFSKYENIVILTKFLPLELSKWFCQNYLRYMISEVKVFNNRMDK